MLKFMQDLIGGLGYAKYVSRVEIFCRYLFGSSPPSPATRFSTEKGASRQMELKSVINGMGGK